MHTHPSLNAHNSFGSSNHNGPDGERRWNWPTQLPRSFKHLSAPFQPSSLFSDAEEWVPGLCRPWRLTLGKSGHLRVVLPFPCLVWCLLSCLGSIKPFGQPPFVWLALSRVPFLNHLGDHYLCDRLEQLGSSLRKFGVLMNYLGCQYWQGS